MAVTRVATLLCPSCGATYDAWGEDAEHAVGCLFCSALLEEIPGTDTAVAPEFASEDPSTALEITGEPWPR